MRFPLPTDTFPPLNLSEDDQFELQKLSDGFIQEALEEYTHFRYVDGGVLDKERWKLVKAREGVASYRDLRMMDPERSRVAPADTIRTCSWDVHQVECINWSSCPAQENRSSSRLFVSRVHWNFEERFRRTYRLQFDALAADSDHPRAFKAEYRTSERLYLRQQSPGKLELYVKGFVDAMGNVHQSIAIPVTADALMSFNKVVHCGQMKKLNWLLKTKKTVILDHHSDDCTACGKPVSRSKSCQVCMNTMCSRCTVAKKLSFLSPTNRRVSQRGFAFCLRCILAAHKADGLEIAAEELVRQNPFDFYEKSTASSTSSKVASPSNSIPPDATSEFFG